MNEAIPSDRQRIEGWPAHTWESIEAQYREGVEKRGYSWLAPMAELASRIQRSGISRSLHALTTMHDLVCMMHPIIYFDEAKIIVSPSADNTYEFQFKHPTGPVGRRINDWTATYPSEQVSPAFSRFLARVGWIPEGHPAHLVLTGRA